MKKKTPKVDLEGKIALCQEYTKMWADFFNYFADGFVSTKVTANSEAQFFRLMTDLARKQFRLSYFMNHHFDRGDKIEEFLGRAVSLTNLQEMPEAEFSKYQHDWHVIFIALNKCLGKLLEERPIPKESRSKKNGGAPKEKAGAPQDAPATDTPAQHP